MTVDIAPDTAGRPQPDTEELPSVSVVICAYTDQRWDDVLAAVQSVRDQQLPAREIILVVDHNEPLRRRLTRRCPTCASWRTRPAGPVRRQEHRCRPRER